MQLLRRILAVVVIALVALLPGATHAASHAAVSPRAAAQHDAATADHHAAAGCAGHHRGAGGPAHHPCRTCPLDCCAPALVALAVPAPSRARRAMLLRRLLPSADRRYAGVSPAEGLRPPIPL